MTADPGTDTEPAGDDGQDHDDENDDTTATTIDIGHIGKADDDRHRTRPMIRRPAGA